MKVRLCAALMSSLFFVGMPLFSWATTTYTWSGASSANWSNTGNWQGGLVANSTSAVALFGTYASQDQPTLDESVNIDQIQFTGSGWTIGADAGDIFTLNNSGAGVSGSTVTSGTNTISAGFSVAGVSSGAIVFSTGTGSVLQLTGAITGTTAASIEYGASGSTGTVVISGANSYVGNNLIYYGTVELGSSSALGSASNLLKDYSGTTLDLEGNNLTLEALYSSSSNGGGLIQSTAAATVIINGISGTGNYGGTFGGAVALTFNLGNGNTMGMLGTTLSANTGATTIQSGELNLNATLPSGSGSQVGNGQILVNGGSLNLGNITSLEYYAGTQALTVEGGMLSTSVALTSGSATVNIGVTMTSGVISLGNSGTVGTAGSLTLTSGHNFSMSGGTLDFDLGSSSDKILSLGSGTFSITGGTLALTLDTGFSYAASYQVFSGFTSGSVANLAITGYDTTDYTASLSSLGALSFQAVPEPQTWGLLGMGALLLAFTGRTWSRQRGSIADRVS